MLACDQYYNDLKLDDNSTIEVVCDEAIFRRVLKYYQKNPRIRPLLGQWHVSKMCTVLISLFSGYGIFNLATALGVVFLDKFEKVVDYRSTCSVLEMIWFVVGVALHIYLKQYNKTIEQIINEDNNLLKTWLFYFKWAGW